MLIVHVDISFNGFMRRWGLGRFSWIKDHFISWRYVQPLSLEDAGATDAVSLSVTRNQVQDLPGEDLADALEELSGDQQQAFFSVLDADKAAETLIAAEPRTQRQLVADLRREKARVMLEQMSVPQLANLLSVLPHDDAVKMLELLPREDADRITAIISEHETIAATLMSDEYVAAQKEDTAGAILEQVRTPGHEPEAISYIYVIDKENKFLLGVVDLRELVLAAPETRLDDIMVTPVVSAQKDDVRDTIEELFAKYHFRMLPVVDAQDRLLGVIRYNDIMTGLVILAKR
jgi:Mg/Co/Ni transporter MgtE